MTPSRPVLRSAAVAGLAIAVLGARAGAQEAVWTQHNDNARTGARLVERTLTTANVNAGSFGKLFTRAVDDQIYGQPLYVPGVEIPGRGRRNVVYVATVNATVYAFDADDPSEAAALWRVSFVDPASGIIPVANTDVGQRCGVYADFSGNIGIVGTPVVDVERRTIFFVARTRERGVFVQRLHALDVATGRERAGSPVAIDASVRGTGAGSDANGVVRFDPRTQNQRAALTLANGIVYVAWASHCDTGPYHGWVMGYDASTLAQVAVLNLTPDGSEGGLWQSGQGLSVDDRGLVYFAVGNGTADAHAGGANYGTSVVKTDANLRVLDFFTPHNFEALNAADVDLGSAGVLLIPETNLATTAGKEGRLYLLDRDRLGRFRARRDSQIVQSFFVSGPQHHLHGSPVYWKTPEGQQLVYLWTENEDGRAYRLANGRFRKKPFTRTRVAPPEGMPGAMLSISSNGSSEGTGILWATHPRVGDANHMTRPGVLKAFDATDLSRQLWTSQMNPERDDFGNFAKFSYPTVAEGRVYVATFSNQLAVYGLLGPTPNAPPSVDAGPDRTVAIGSALTLTGSASDDGAPAEPGRLTTTWVQVSGPGTATIAAPGSLTTSATFSLPGLYVLRLSASDGRVASDSDVTVSVEGGPPVVGTGSGLAASYFDEIDFSGVPVTRVDPTIDFPWGTEAPAPGIEPDTFSVRWEGQVQAQFSELYTFHTLSDDGVRLWIDGSLVLDNWTDHAAIEDVAYVPLLAGRKYDIRMEMYERGGVAVARLFWSSISTPKRIVPASQLYPAPRARKGE